MLPPRAWPTRLRVSAVVVAALLAQAIALAVHLVIVERAGGFPERADAASEAVEGYGAHVLMGFAPAVVVVVVGLISALPAMRDTDAQVAAWGRLFVGALALLTVAIAALSYPWLSIGW